MLRILRRLRVERWEFSKGCRTVLPLSNSCSAKFRVAGFGRLFIQNNDIGQLDEPDGAKILLRFGIYSRHVEDHVHPVVVNTFGKGDSGRRVFVNAPAVQIQPCGLGDVGIDTFELQIGRFDVPSCAQDRIARGRRFAG